MTEGRIRGLRKWLAGGGAAVVIAALTFLFGPGILRSSPEAPGPIQKVLPTSPQVAGSTSTSPPPPSSPSPTVPTSANPVIAPPPSVPMPGTVLYEANWSGGMAGWVGSGEWKAVPGLLVSDGSGEGYTDSRSDSAIAPYQPNTADYAIETRIQIASTGQGSYYVGIVGRSQTQEPHGGYLGGVRWPKDGLVVADVQDYGHVAFLGSMPFSPGSGWHIYRAEFKGTLVSLFVDGSPVVHVTDTQFLDPGVFGLASSNCQVQVSSYKVVAL